MMENLYAIIEDGRVANIAVANGVWPFPEQHAVLIQPGQAAIGWLYQGGQFVDPTPPAPPQVPQSITMRQCRLHLLATGKLGLVDAAIASLPSPEREQAEIEWEYAAVVWRNSPLIAQLAPVLGWDTPEQIDAQFIAANAIV